ncbi:ENTH domain-containing protein [Mycena kentingensis (nom. inval.)]|nr:ENTH domain-containing protein [Mycena kentingensis (nom. inval.)]
MSSYEKVVKGACKPKAAPPKAKYLDPIIAATWDEGGAVHDVCKALSPKFREPNAVVVFKALIVLHTMIRNGSTDNVLAYLSGSQVLRLHNVSAGNWDGYAAPENLQHYASYLDARIRAYRDLKHDAIRVQSDSNRDARTGHPPQPQNNTLQRSKTLAGRKLRSMTVEKGLLRETKVVHRMIDALVGCRFYLDDLEDPLTLTALRMLVKDLLILFQAGNEGVINLLEHYFEMSHIDAKEALEIYRHFCAQTEHVVEYLGVARKLQNLLNVPVPNLKHAPVSLANALQEYLDDPAFEQNRIEYKLNKEALKGGRKAKSDTPPVPALPASASASTSTTKPAPSATTTANGDANGKSKPDVLDFFAGIEETQPTMFNPATNSPNTAYFQQMAANPNPFQRMQGQPTGMPAFNAQMTGAFGGQPMQPMGGGLQPQATGFNPFSGARPMSSFGPLAAQATGAGMGAFGAQPQVTGAFGAQLQPTGAFGAQPQPTGAFGAQPQPTGAFGAPTSAFGVQPQPTGAFGAPLPPQQPQQTATPPFLRPQITGGAANPFRASQAFPGSMSMGGPSMSAGPTLGGAGPGGGGLGTGLRPQMTGGAANPFRASMMMSQGTGPAAFGTFGAAAPPAVPAIPPFMQNATNDTNPAGAGIPRPASAPLTAFSTFSPSPSANAPTTASTPTGGLQPVKTHTTGTRNPFGAPAPKPEEVPPIPKQPTLMELAMGVGQPQATGQFGLSQPTGQFGLSAPTAQPQQPQATGFAGSSTKAFDYSKSALGPSGGTDMGSVATEFAFKPQAANGAATSPTATGSGTGSSLFSSFTGTTATSTSSPSITFSSSSSSGSFSPTVSSFTTGGFDHSKSALNNPSPSPLSSSTTSSSAFSTTPSAFSAQPTGSALKGGFKPTSSFGASLLEALPAIPGSPASPAAIGAQSTGFFSAAGGGSGWSWSWIWVCAWIGIWWNGDGNNASPAPATNTTGVASTLGVGLRPQTTGGPNPFRASVAMGGGGAAMPPMPTGMGGGAFGGGAFGGMPNGGAFGAGGGAFGQPPAQQQQNGSLI